MEPWSSTYRSYAGNHVKNNNMEIVKRGNRNGINEMFVGRSQPRPMDLTVYYEPHERKTKKRSSGSSTSWWNDPETKRRRRVAKYKLYSAEGKFKASLKKGLRWFKRKCSQIARRF